MACVMLRSISVIEGSVIDPYFDRIGVISADMYIFPKYFEPVLKFVQVFTPPTRGLSILQRYTRAGLNVIAEN